MRKAFALLFGSAMTFAALVQPAAAYNGYYSDIRYGDHPYETRRYDEDRRKFEARHRQEFGTFVYDNPAYFHPLYARRMQLHPYFRKGGVSNYIAGRYARWRGYLDPVQAHALSPDTYCSNFSYQRYQYRGEPLGYECF